MNLKGLVITTLFLFTFQSVAVTPTPKVQPQIQTKKLVMAQNGEPFASADSCHDCDAEEDESEPPLRATNIQIMDEDHISIHSTHHFMTVIRIGLVVISHAHLHEGPLFPLLRPPRLS